MRKFITVLILMIIFFIIFFMQTNIFNAFTIAGIKPNLFIVFVLFIGLFTNQSLGIGFGVICGFIIDLIYGRVIGTTAIMLCIIGYLGSYFDKNFSKENKLTIMLMVIGSTIIYELGLYFINSVILDFDREYLSFFKILVVEVIYNMLLTIIIYPLIQKSGYILERTFKRNNILTRYF